MSTHLYRWTPFIPLGCGYLQVGITEGPELMARVDEVAVVVGGSAGVGHGTAGVFAARVEEMARWVCGRAARAGDEHAQGLRTQAPARGGAVACSAGTWGWSRWDR